MKKKLKIETKDFKHEPQHIHLEGDFMIDEVAKLGWELVANIKTWFGRDGGVLHLLLPRFFVFFFYHFLREPGSHSYSTLHGNSQIS